MALGVWKVPAAVAAGVLPGGPLLERGGSPVADLAAGAVGVAAGAAAGAVRAGVRGVDTAARVGRVTRHAVTGARGAWRSGRRAHLALRPTSGEKVDRLGGLEQAARRVARLLAERPDVAYAYWDGGLGRLVLAATEDAVSDRVLDRAAELAERHGLGPSDDPVEEFPHPGDPAGVRNATAALLIDLAGTAAGLTAYTLRLPPSPRLVTAAVTLLRENPRFRGFLGRRVGRSRMDLLLAAANATAHAAGQTPTALVLDGALRGLQLTETVARATAFDAAHDLLCAPDRVRASAATVPRPPLRPSPASEYAANAGTGSVLGAAATLLIKHDANEAAEAVLAGSPKAARYGPAAFNAVLCCALARSGVVVRDSERLRQLETVESVLLHPSALRAPGGGVDAWAEAVLDAARGAGLRVVMVEDPALADFTVLADHVVPADRPLTEAVASLRRRGGVLTVARHLPAPGDDGPAHAAGGATAAPDDVLAGLLAGDVAVATANGDDAAVAWAADVIAPGGLPDVWRLLRAVPAAKAVSGRAQTLAKSGAALSGLLVAVGDADRGGRRTPLPGLRHAPVDVAAAAALLGGARSALGVALARSPHPRERVAWHALHPDDVRDRLARRPQEQPGLSEQAADRVQAAAGRAGRVPALKPLGWAFQLARAVRHELDDPLTPVLAVGSAAEAVLGSAADALLVVGALDLNALVGGVQRLRAERAVAALIKEHRQKARIAAEDAGDDAPRTVDAAKLHPGDVIELQADDVVPADARLLWADGLEVDESALTGESLPVDKRTEPTPRASVADRRCMVFEGTTVVAGHARAVVVETGDRTEASRAVHLAARTPPAAGVQARLQELTRKALPLTLAGGAAVTGLSLLRGTALRDAVSGGVAVAVAAVPEGLPLVATVAQLAAARRLSRRGVLVRAPRTLEALGRMDTVCFDKTGTLTENRLRLVRVTEADGTVHGRDEAADSHTLTVAARACPRTNGGSDRPVHATDEAVLEAAAADPEWTQTEGLPFEAARGYAAAVGHAADGARTLVVKGAPENVLPACTAGADEADDTAHRLAGNGLRVLAVAERRLRDGETDADALEGPLGELEFTGLVALADVARETSPELVRSLEAAGVRPVMLTGDHPQTARAIAVELGWPEDTVVVTGDELASADRSERAGILRDAGVVARVAPEQKLQVVEALRDAGRVVGMVGDGANDAAAIRAADVGVGLNARGSAAARNAADIVLTDDDMRVLIEAVHEGRALWHSVADAIAILIGGNAGEVGFGIVGTLLGRRAPLSTRQMLLVNLFTDLFPAMAVAVTPVPRVTEDTDGPLGTALLGAPLIDQIRHRALTTCLGAVAAWLFGRFTPGTQRRSTTMALCALVGTQLAQTLADRRESGLVRATVLGSAVALVLLVQTPGASRLFGCTPLGPVAWAGVCGSIVLALAGQRALPRLEETVLRLKR
ncbi:cation-translocating P-type ATPase [Streptomyces longwoodensis]|uniref:cation-translocating P-type ATPase n=1 Tax=Streptomyces longwoodensis TaxID=68231 RepID=UPI0033D6D198